MRQRLLLAAVIIALLIGYICAFANLINKQNTAVISSQTSAIWRMQND